MYKINWLVIVVMMFNSISWYVIMKAAVYLYTI